MQRLAGFLASEVLVAMYHGLHRESRVPEDVRVVSTLGAVCSSLGNRAGVVSPGCSM